MHLQMTKAGLTVKGMSTDSLFVSHDEMGKLQEFKNQHPKLFDTSSTFRSIGKWKIEDEKWCRKKQIKQKEKQMIVRELWTDPPTIVKADYEDEWETNPKYLESANAIFDHHDVLSTATYPGSGKSHNVIQYLLQNYLKTHQHQDFFSLISMEYGLG